ncbi:tyrosine-protein phosphatase [Actinomycetospora sp. CA-084318]|uniref:tyrosine-protein phosphatase n=1 Tax=Actinomycetospora sp. CA-084318 TaxID=3239892 RepID=UPI003D98ABF5
MSADRAIAWEGFYNVRDLGGLPTVDGQRTKRARVYRSAALSLATRAGWEAAYAAGVRTIVSLLNDDEVAAVGARQEVAPQQISHVRVPLDAVEDVPLWDQIAAEGRDGTPLYYSLLLGRHPERAADAVRAITQAEPGAVLFHCGAGRDRTGLVAALLLVLADVTVDAVIEDYEQSAVVQSALDAALGRPSQQPLVEMALRARGRTARSAMQEFLDEVDVPELLLRGGLTDGELAAACARLRH